MVPLIAGILLPGPFVTRIFGKMGCDRHSGGTLDGLTLVPVSEDLRSHIGRSERSVVAGFVELDQELLQFLIEASGQCPIGYIESLHRHGSLHQAAAVWHRGELALTPCSGTVGVVSRAVRTIHERDAQATS